MVQLRRSLLSVALLGFVISACAPAPPSQGSATAVYSKTTGKLEQLVADENSDGKDDTRAFMDGATLKRIEIDRNRDGRPDRWEDYTTVEPTKASPGGPQIVRAEEANGPDERITRREQYEGGEISLVEEDTDLDGRIDKWETYKDKQLVYVDLDLDGSGRPNRRLTYSRNGDVTSGPMPAAGSQ